MNNVVDYKYKVSIILPCYNVACYIDNAVNAILKQTFTDYEVIFINDGSTDNTLEVIKKHCFRSQFKVYDFLNQGVAQARMKVSNYHKVNTFISWIQMMI